MRYIIYTEGCASMQSSNQPILKAVPLPPSMLPSNDSKIVAADVAKQQPSAVQMEKTKPLAASKNTAASNNSHSGWKPSYNTKGLTDLLACVNIHNELKNEIKNNIIFNTTVSQQLPDLGECACGNHDFDRKKNSRRQDAAARIVAAANDRFASKTRLNYLSMGSGLLMQDFIICAMLLLDGYSLCVRLIEPNCTQEDFMKAYKQFCFLQEFARGMGVQFEAESFPSINDYMKSHAKEQIHVGHAIDFDVYTHVEKEAKQDLLKAHQMLSPQGFFYLAVGAIDLLFNKSTAHAYTSSMSSARMMNEFMKASGQMAKSVTTKQPAPG